VVDTSARDLVRHRVEACRVISITAVIFWFMLMILIGSLENSSPRKEATSSKE
jgi:hypothetical protein